MNFLRFESLNDVADIIIKMLTSRSMSVNVCITTVSVKFSTHLCAFKSKFFSASLVSFGPFLQIL